MKKSGSIFILLGLVSACFLLPCRVPCLSAEEEPEAAATAVVNRHTMKAKDGNQFPGFKRRQYGQFDQVDDSGPAPRQEEGKELVNEPILNSSPIKATPEPTPTPVEIPRSQQMIKSYSYVPSAADIPRSTPGKHVRVFSAEPGPPVSDGGELETEPLFANSQPVSSEVRSFQAELDRNQVHLDESFTLSLEIVVPDLQQLGPFQLSGMQDFSLINEYQSEIISTAEQKVWKVRTKRFVYLAQHPGTFTLPPVEVVYQGRRYRTQPLTLVVEGSRSGFAYRQGFGRNFKQDNVVQAAPDAGGVRAENADFTASLSAAKVYVNQQLILKVHLRFRTDRETKVNYVPPPVTGFLMEELPQTNTEENVSGGDHTYLEHNYRTALFPVLSGSLSIGSAQVRFTHQGKERAQITDSMNVLVQPLPPDPEPVAPETGNRLVGQYHMTASVESKDVEVNAPIHLILRLQGQGNIRDAQEPFIEKAGGQRLYLEDRREKISLNHEAVEGERTYRYLIVFDKPGQFSLGRAWIRYFNPGRDRWESADTGIPEIAVRPRAKKSGEEEQAGVNRAGGRLVLRPNHAGRSTLRTQDQSLLDSLWFWLVQALGPLLIGIALAAKILKQRALADPQALRSRRAFPLAKKSMGHLQAYIAKGDIQIFYAALAKAVTEYLAAKFSVPTAYIGVERLPEYYERFQVPEKIGAPFKVALMACEYVRYAAVVLPARDMRALHRDLRTAFHDFEKWWEEKHVKKTKKIPMAGIIILLLLAARAYAGDAELNFWRGNAFAEKGNYESAEAEYRKAIGDRVEDPDLSFNLGNAYAKQGKIGPAILAYERGLCFAPRDEDLRYNLSQVSSLVQNPQVREPRAPLKTWFIGVYRFFTADELAVGASVYYFLTIGWIVLMITWPERGPGRYRSVAGVLLACSLLLTAWSAARSHEHDWWKRAVVMVSKADVYARPYPRADVLFTLHEGTRVALKHEEEVWVEIELSSEQRGWIERSALGIIE